MSNQDLVTDFMQKINQIDQDHKIDISNITTRNIKNIKLRLILMLEKSQEIFESVVDQQDVNNNYNSLFNILKKQISFLKQEDININKENLAIFLADMLYISYGTAALFEIKLQDCFMEIHKSNVSKISSFTGNPIYREDGKLLYDDSYSPPNVLPFIS